MVVPGSRAVSKGKGQEWGLSLYAAGHREIPRRQNRPEHDTGGTAALIKLVMSSGEGSYGAVIYFPPKQNLDGAQRHPADRPGASPPLRLPARYR